MRKNAGGVYNHQLYFDGLTPVPRNPGGQLKEALLLSFGTLEAFQKTFFQMAMALFGSGYLWLVCDNRGKLVILPTASQDTPLSRDLYPLMNLDLWEHAYYLKHQNRRADYIQDWFPLVNWEEAGRRYDQALLSIALQDSV